MKFEVQLEHDGDSEMYEDLSRYLKFHPQLARFLFNPAGLTFLIGWFLFFGMLLGWLAIFLLDPASARAIALTSAAEAFPGKEASVALGIAIGLHPVIVWGVVTIQDLITTMWVYPLFYLFRRKQAGKQNFFGYFFTKMERNAKKHEKFIERYGAWGLFLFMLIPFAVNGPLIGAILGKLAGIRTRYILPAVVGSAAISTAYWVALWYFAQDWTQRFVAEYGGGYIVVAIVVLFVLFIAKQVLDFVRDVRHFREIQARRRELVRAGHHEQTLVLGETIDVDSKTDPRSHLDD